VVAVGGGGETVCRFSAECTVREKRSDQHHLLPTSRCAPMKAERCTVPERCRLGMEVGQMEGRARARCSQPRSVHMHLHLAHTVTAPPLPPDSAHNIAITAIMSTQAGVGEVTHPFMLLRRLAGGGPVSSTAGPPTGSASTTSPMMGTGTRNTPKISRIYLPDVCNRGQSIDGILEGLRPAELFIGDSGDACTQPDRRAWVHGGNL
jgi:hypothetical protein